MARRNRDLSPDPQGRYRPYLGWKHGEDGKKRQHRFNLGTDRKEAERRLAKLRELYDENCRVVREDLWSPLALSYAEEIARGRHRITYFPPPPELCIEDPATDYAQMLQVDRDRFPSLDLIPSDPTLHAESARRGQQGVVKDRIRELEAELRELGALGSKESLPEELIPGSLHEALDDYEASIAAHNVRPGTSDLTPYGRLRLARVERFRKAHDDIPLSALTHDACSAMAAYWRGRPKGMRGLTSRDNARHHVGELIRFYKWLDRTGKYRWRMPSGVGHIDRKIGKTDAERKLSVITKRVYSAEQLATINKHATPTERLLLYLGLNCAMGAAEMGRLARGDILLGHRHEYAERLHFSSTDEDSFIRFLRPKTEVFGEWLVWPETARMLRWGLERSKKIGSELLLVSEEGMPWYREHATNAQYHFANAWTRLLKRVRKSDPDFPILPFGTLRDTLPDLLRHRESDDLASLCLAHGQPFQGDNLLECYGNRPFGRLHDALRRMHAYFAPVFAAAPDDPTEEVKQYLPAAVREKVRALIAEGKKAPTIARECGVSAMTVYREMKRYDY
ncbi:helix-turn-helix domain-containing protein [Planctomyces sp. SH-PL62]|uniref:helix-turn-helix domain-containing protein n=1 Tax=Planctomyces sp. SH-PL62 TaxID=1636152 RepID=UPI00078EF3E0|nr:helix-turn-helix domain-containing protein [Planctomyces sp. SH-PL62]AMV40224.1 hypothetical protein VT85_22525 [Planctomyces sp. SH-PL62]